MKKINYIALLSALVCIGTTSCGTKIDTSAGFEQLEAKINEIQNNDFTKSVKNVDYYIIEKYKEPFTFTNPTPGTTYPEDLTVQNYRIVEDQILYRLDFSNPNDYYYYEFHDVEFDYCTSYNDRSGNANYESVTAKYGKQFYQKDGKYYYKEIKGITKNITNLELDKHPYINKDSVAGLETALAAGSLSIADGQKLFNNYIVPVAKQTLMANMNIVNTLESEKSGIYNYVDTGNGLSITANQIVEFDYQSSILYEENGSTYVKGHRGPILSPVRATSSTTTENDTISYTTKNAFWAETETKTAEANRNVSFNFTNSGWLASANVEDARTAYEYNLASGCEKFISSYYLTSTFNQPNMPHPYTK